jgi:hypothetical protein
LDAPIGASETSSNILQSKSAQATRAVIKFAASLSNILQHRAFVSPQVVAVDTRGDRT